MGWLACRAFPVIAEFARNRLQSVWAFLIPPAFYICVSLTRNSSDSISLVNTVSRIIPGSQIGFRFIVHPT